MNFSAFYFTPNTKPETVGGKRCRPQSNKINIKTVQMIYFKTVRIDLLESGEVETRIRKASIKSLGHLDLTSSTSLIGTEKKFFGHENEKYLLITRIRGPIEEYLPKLIVKFDKEQGFIYYKIRFSLLATTLVGLSVILTISLLAESLNAQQFDFEFILMLLIVTSLILLTLLEMKVTQKVINKVLLKDNSIGA